MEGLAQQAAMGQQQMQISPDMIEQIVMMLEQGISPQELMAKGVPVEAIEAAMGMLSQQATARSNNQAGMANMVLPQPGM